MDPELIDQVEPAAKEDHRRRKADQEQRQAKKEGQAEEARPRLPQRGRQIIVLRAVVDDVARPEPAHPVRGAVKDIIGEIVEQEAQDTRPPPATEIEDDLEQNRKNAVKGKKRA